MSRQAPVLVGLANPRTAEHLVHLGIQLARARDTGVVFVGVVLVPAGHSLSTGARPARTQRRLLRSAQQAAAAAGVSGEIVVRSGYEVDETLIEVAAELDAGLLLVGWPPLPRFGQPVETPLWRLSQQPPCDLVALYHRDGLGAPRRLLVPVRGGPHADLAADLTAALATLWAGQVTMLRVIPEYVPVAEADAEALAFQAFWESRYPGTVTARSITAASVQDALLAEAAVHDLMVIGAAPSSRSYPYPFGRLAEEIAARASCSVLVVKTEQQLTVDEHGSSPEQAVSGADQVDDVRVTVDKWFAANTFHSKEFAGIGDLVRAKQQQELTISVVLPTLNEEETIGPIIDCLQEELQRRYPLVDELVLIDSGSQDRTTTIAAARGVPVYVHQQILPELGSFHGKGEALWKSLSVTRGDLVAWIDTDIVNIHAKFVYGILGPLLRDPRIGYVKGFYRRPLRQGDTLQEGSGGRVTELMARPLINLFYPQLSGLIQPLSGEYAGRREMLAQVPFQTGYGVEIGLLIDILERFGLHAIGQVDLQRRIHRNQSLASLSRMSFAILQVVLARLERQEQIRLTGELHRSLKMVEQSRGGYHLDERRVEEHERPPMDTVQRRPVSAH